MRSLIWSLTLRGNTRFRRVTLEKEHLAKRDGQERDGIIIEHPRKKLIKQNQTKPNQAQSNDTKLKAYSKALF